jgi:hypothetical protein
VCVREGRWSYEPCEVPVVIAPHRERVDFGLRVDRDREDHDRRERYYNHGDRNDHRGNDADRFRDARDRSDRNDSDRDRERTRYASNDRGDRYRR